MREWRCGGGGDGGALSLSWEPEGEDAGATPHRYHIQQVSLYSWAPVQNSLTVCLSAEMWRRRNVTVAEMPTGETKYSSQA